MLSHHHQSPAPPPSPTPTSSSAPSTTTTTTTITTLSSLLPPLPRAQSLLLQMSSLASKLFELSPNRSIWSSSYRSSLPSFLPNPNPSNSNGSGGGGAGGGGNQTTLLPSNPTSTKEALSLFHSLQTSLFESVSHLQEILDLQDSTSSLTRLLSLSDSSLLTFSRTLHLSHSVLDRLVDDYSEYYTPHPKLDLQQTLAYAHKISYTTFAPPDHAANQAPLRGALPPAPQDNEMRASQLYHFADLDVGLPPKKRPKITEPDAQANNDDDDDVLMEPTPPRGDIVPPGAMLPIAVPPPGWKKGMPVELPPMPAGWKPGDPVLLPPVPAGWKPGDPVPLPPLEGKEEERGVVQRRGVEKAPEAIQVKYVQLDIGGDEDEYSSEYSSEVGSSDEDEDD